MTKRKIPEKQPTTFAKLGELRALFQQLKVELEKLPGVKVSIAVSIQMVEAEAPEPDMELEEL